MSEELIQEINQEVLTVRTPHLIVSLENQMFAIDIKCIQEILTLPKTVPIPNTPEHLRGAINLRGKVVPILDLRLKLGMAANANPAIQLLEMLYKREQDHYNWVITLENSIKDNRPFTLAQDPHQCAFGKWYYAYRNNDPTISQILAKFEEPHRILHESATVILALADRGQKNEALDKLGMLRKTELKILRELFEELRVEMQATMVEQTVIFKKDELQLGICVDTVDATEIIDPATIEDVTHRDMQKSGLISKTARNSLGEVVLMLDVEPLLVEQ